MNESDKNAYIDLVQCISSICGAAGLIRDNMILAGFDRSEAVETSIRFMLDVFKQAGNNEKDSGKKNE